MWLLSYSQAPSKQNLHLFASSISIRFFERIFPSPSCSRKCSTLMLTISWQRPLTTTSYALHHNHDLRRCLRACPWNNIDHSGNRLNITRAVVLKQLEYSYAYTYNEDYDEDNLHMTPNSVTSQDREQLDEFEMARPECEALQYDCDLQSGVTEFGNCNYCSHEDAFESSQDKKIGKYRIHSRLDWTGLSQQWMKLFLMLSMTMIAELMGAIFCFQKRLKYVFHTKRRS